MHELRNTRFAIETCFAYSEIPSTFCRSYWETIVFCVYGVPVGKIWRKQDARLAGSTFTYRITLPEPHWMLATVGRIFTVPFPELILYREKVTRPRILDSELFSIQTNCSQACVGEFANVNSTEFSWACNYYIYLAKKSQNVGRGQRGRKKMICYSVRKVSDIDAM